MYVKAVYHVTEITMSLQRRIILLGKTLYFERRSVHCCVPCCGVLFKTNLRESEWSCWRFSSYCARKYITIVWFFCFNCLKGKKCKRVSFSLWHRTHETWWRHLIKLAHYNRSQECHSGFVQREVEMSVRILRDIFSAGHFGQQLPCNFRWLVKTRDHGYIKLMAILFHILSFCLSGFSSPRGSPTRLTWNSGLHQCSERGTRNSRGPGHYCDVCGNWYAASRDRRRHIWRSQVWFSSHYPYLGPWHGALASTAATVAKTSRKKWICAASNYFALIPSRSICQILANFSGVEF